MWVMELSQILLDLLLCPQSFLFGILAVAFYYLCWRPFDYYKDVSDLGFDDVKKTNSKFGKTVSKVDVINEVLRRRKFGDTPPPYPHGWYHILDSDQLPVNRIKEVGVLGLELVSWRGVSGQVYVADAYCPHLGAHLGVGGTVTNGECITCSFHGWEFQGSDGKVCSIPYSDSKSLAKLKMYRVKEYKDFGLIFFWFHSDGEEPSWSPEFSDEIKNSRFRYRGRSEFRIACHVQEAFENSADVNHLGVLHVPCVFSGVDASGNSRVWDVLQHDLRGKVIPVSKDEKTGKPQNPHIHRFILTHSLKLFGLSCWNAGVRGHQPGPGLVVMLYDTEVGLGLLLLTVTPLEPMLQKVVQRFYTVPSFIHPFALLYFYGFRVHFMRDVYIWNRKTYLRSPPLPKEDSTVTQYRRWYSQFYPKDKPDVVNGVQSHSKYFSKQNNDF